jgi:hypothetical protein
MSFIKPMFLLFLLLGKINAGTVDVYGVSSKISEKILNAYGGSIDVVEEARVKRAMKQLSTTHLEMRSKYLTREIQKKFRFKKLNMDTVYYPENEKMYTTISICTDDFIKKNSHQAYPVKNTKDVVDEMHFFIPKAINFYVTHPEYVTKMNCRDYHCISPEHPKLNNYLNYFRQEVPKQTVLIERTLFKDNILERRRAAIFLLGYYQDPKKINQLLIDLLDDPSLYIRHDVLRVYGELYAKSPNLDVPVEKIIHSIYSCDTAERNKGLILLNELSKNKKYQHILIKKAGKQLIVLLKLKQPNNHLFAYSILKNITHQNYSETDFLKWKKWIVFHS